VGGGDGMIVHSGNFVGGVDLHAALPLKKISIF